MSNPFLTLPSFGQDYTSQYNFFEGIKSIINGLESKDPIIIESTTVPTQVQMETLYLAAAVGNALPVPTSQVFIWVNQGIVQGEYRTIDDIYANINDSSIQRLQSNSGFTFLMANGDIIASLQTDYSLISTSTLKKYDRRTGLLADISLTVNATWGQMWPDPTGTKLAFTKLDGGGKRQVYTCTYPALGAITQLTSSATGVFAPSWQNGKIAYVDIIAGSYVIRIMNDDGTGQTSVLNTGVTTGIMYLALSPDASKIIYTKLAGSANAVDIWMVNANGTGNVKIVNGLDYTNDNPDGFNTGGTDAADCTSQWIIPNWSADGQWIHYGRRRKNVSTLLSERWFDFIQTNDNARNQVIQSYYSQGLAAPPEWSQKNLTTSLSAYGGSPTQPASRFVYIPTFSHPIYGGKAFIVSSLAVTGTTLVSNTQPGLLVANQSNGYKSTGKIYKVSQFVPDRNDFELIRQDVATGTETTFSVSKSELENYDHLLIVYNGSQTVAAGDINIYLNEDSGANYHNVELLASTTIERFYAFGANSINLRGSGAAALNQSGFQVMLYDIKSTDNYKTAYAEHMYTVSGAALAIANYFSGDALGTWKSTAAIESLRIVGTQPFAATATFSYYGIRGTPRFEKDL